MLSLVTVLVGVVAVFLILAILIQNPKGGGIDSTYGSGANQMFGAARSADAIEKITRYLFAALVALCIISYFLITKSGGAADVNLQSRG